MVEVTEALLIDGETAVVDVDVGTLIVGNVVVGIVVSWNGKNPDDASVDESEAVVLVVVL